MSTFRSGRAPRPARHPHLQALGYGAVLTVVFLLVLYPGTALLRELLGQPGLALSPLLLSPLVWLVSSLYIALEDRVQAQPWWPRVEDAWYWSVLALGIGVPVVVALVRPAAVLTGAPAGIPTLVALAPAVLVGMAAALWYDPGAAPDPATGR